MKGSMAKTCSLCKVPSGLCSQNANAFASSLAQFFGWTRHIGSLRRIAVFFLRALDI